MDATLSVERATTVDIEALGALRLAQGWHASQDLFRVMMDWPQAYIVLARETAPGPHATTPGKIIASVSAILADRVGVIGNVIVHPEFRRRGLGRLTMNATLDWLRDHKASTALLDATQEGQPLYTQLGFVPLANSWDVIAPLTAFNRAQLQQLAGATQAQLRAAGDIAQVRDLDTTAFGGNRIGLLERTLHQPQNWLVIATNEQQEPTGYLMYGRLRNSSIHIGPLVAHDQAAAAALMAAVLREDAAWRPVLGNSSDAEAQIRLSAPGIAPEILSFYRSLGLTPIKDDVLMQLDLADDNDTATTNPVPYPGIPQQVYAWLAPMVF